MNSTLKRLEEIEAGLSDPCPCYDLRTGEMKASKRKRLCTCPVAVIVGKRRAKLMARLGRPVPRSLSASLGMS